MRADHVLRPGRGAGDLVDVEGRGVGGEQRARLGNPVEIGEHPLFEFHLLEHGLDHDIGFGRRVDSDHAGDQAHAAIHLLGGEPAARHCGAVIGGDPVAAFLQQILAGLDQGRPECRHWRSTWRCRRPSCRRRRPPRGAIGRGSVPAGMFGTFAASRSAKKTWRCAFDWSPATSFWNSSLSRRKPSSNGKVKALRTASTQAAGASRPRSRRVSAAAVSSKLLGSARVATSLSSRSRDLLQWASLGNDAAGEGDRRGRQVTLDDFVDDAVSERPRRRRSGRR